MADVAGSFSPLFFLLFLLLLLQKGRVFSFGSRVKERGLKIVFTAGIRRLQVVLLCLNHISFDRTGREKNLYNEALIKLKVARKFTSPIVS